MEFPLRTSPMNFLKEFLCIIGMPKHALVFLLTLNKSKKLSSYFADFEQVIKLSSYFTDFEQIKKTNRKTPVGESRCLCIFFFFVFF